MLSPEEKNKILLEEQYRDEVQKQFKTKSRWDWIDTIIKWLQGIAIVVGIIATYLAYQKQNQDRIDQENARNAQLAKEFRSDFYKNQFELYAEACDVVAILATEKMHSKAYEVAREKFYRLFWGRLAIVEDKTIEAVMVHFERFLSAYETGREGVTQETLQQAALCLAHAASKYTISVWLDSIERKNYNDRKCPIDTLL